MKISRSTALALIFLILAMLIAIDVSAQLEGLTRTFRGANSGDLFKNITSLTFWGAALGFFGLMEVIIRTLKSEWMSAERKIGARILLGMISYLVGDYAATTLGRKAFLLGFKEAAQLAWGVTIVAAFISIYLIEKKGEGGDYASKGIQFAIVWFITGVFIGPYKSVLIEKTQLDQAIWANGFLSMLVFFGSWAYGYAQDKKKQARERAEEEKKKTDNEKNQADNVDKAVAPMINALKDEMKQLRDSQIKMNQGQATVQAAATPQMMYPVFVGMGQTLPTAYLPQIPGITPVIAAPQVYDEDKKEINELVILLDRLKNRYGETNPGKEIVYLNKIVNDLESDIKSGSPANWLSYVGEKRDKAVHADEIERFGNVGSKEVAAKLRKLASREGPTKASIEATIKAAKARIDYLLNLKNKLTKRVQKAIADKQEKSQTHVAAYTKKDEFVRKANALIEELSNESRKVNSELYNLHTLVAESQKITDPGQLKTLFDEFRNKLTQMIEDSKELDDNAPKLSALIKDAPKRFDDITKETLRYNKTASSREIAELLEGKPPEGGAPALLERAS